MDRLIYLMAIILFVSCQTSKLKIFDENLIHDKLSQRYKNVYYKDFDNSYKNIEGKWQWGNQTDTLIIEIKAAYKKSLSFSPENNFQKLNYYQDMAYLKSLKYVMNGKVVIDNLDSNENNLKAIILAEIPKIYGRYIINCCYDTNPNEGLGLTGYLKLVVNNYLEITGETINKNQIFYENKDYKIVIPRNILMKRIKD